MFFIYLLFLFGLLYSDANRVISIRAGGLKGFYMFGICKYIKENHNLDNVSMFGASAGAWNSLFLSEKLNNEKLYNYLTNIRVNNFKNMYEIELLLKRFILNNYKDEDFDLNKLNICVAVLKGCRIKRKTFTNFVTLEDTLDCCLASSHIPYITNRSATYTYKNNNCVDGGFFRDPHNKFIKPDLLIYPDMWDNQIINEFTNINNLDINNLIFNGYRDAYINREELKKKLLL